MLSGFFFLLLFCQWKEEIQKVKKRLLNYFYSLVFFRGFTDIMSEVFIPDFLYLFPPFSSFNVHFTFCFLSMPLPIRASFLWIIYDLNDLFFLKSSILWAFLFIFWLETSFIFLRVLPIKRFLKDYISVLVKCTCCSITSWLFFIRWKAEIQLWEGWIWSWRIRWPRWGW